MLGLIVARSKNNVIGKEGKIPWRIKGEQKQFRELTTGNYVIMGRRSYEEIGRPLPNRVTIVVSTTAEYTGENLYTAKSLTEAIETARKDMRKKGWKERAGREQDGNDKKATDPVQAGEEEKNIYIAGGNRLFEEAMSLVDQMYITEVDLTVEDGDTFFPEFNENEFTKEIGETGGDEITYVRTVYTRKGTDLRQIPKHKYKEQTFT